MNRSVYYIFIASTLSLIGLSPCPACDIPVCRYALEHWTPDAFQVAVLHQGPLDAQGSALVAILEKHSKRANLVLQTIDADHPADEAERALCQANPCVDGPRIVVRFPVTSHIQGTTWQGRLAADAIAAVVDSPRRRDITDRLLGGNEMVWVLLETGRKDADDAAAECIEQELKRPVNDALAPPKSSLVHLSRGDAAEKLLTDTLLSTEPDLRGRDEPMAFPVFGRGRVLYALVGAGINAETVRHALAFLTGGCSCSVKRESPGVDLLLTADWSVITVTTPEEVPPAPATTIDLVPLTPLATSHRPAAAVVGETTANGARGWLIAAVLITSLVTFCMGRLALRSRRTSTKSRPLF